MNEGVVMDGLARIRLEIVASLLLPAGWSFKRDRDGFAYEISDGLNVIAYFPVRHEPLATATISVVRESLANKGRLAGLHLAEFWKKQNVQFDELYLFDHASAFADSVTAPFITWLDFFTAPYRLNSVATRDAITKWSHDRFVQAFYLSAVLNYFDRGTEAFAPDAIRRYKEPASLLASFDSEGLRFNTPIPSFEAEFHESPPLSSWVGQELGLGLDVMRAFIRRAGSGLHRALAPGVGPNDLATNPPVLRIFTYLAKPFAHYLSHTGIGSDFAEARVGKQRDWLIELLAEQVERQKSTTAKGLELPPPPLPKSGFITPLEAEYLCRDWMRSLGEIDAEVTQFTADGGVDVRSKNYVAQVKNYAGSVGAPDILQLVGAAHVEDKIPLFFTSGTYTRQAIQVATRARLPLLRYDSEMGTVEGIEALGLEVVRSGLNVVAMKLRPE